MDLTEKTNKPNRHPWELARLNVIEDLVTSKVSLNKPLSILDVGCGDTFIAEYFAKKYPEIEYHAIDIAFSIEMINELHDKFQYQNLNIKLYSSLKQFNEKGQKLSDIVFLFDVIEHVPSDTGLITEISKLGNINDETLFFITVPAYQKLFTSHDTFIKHYRRYNSQMLVDTASKSSLTIINKGNFFSVLLIPRILKVLHEKINKPKEQSETGIGQWDTKKTDGMIVKVLTSDYLILKALQKIGLKIPGLSKFMICKKLVS